LKKSGGGVSGRVKKEAILRSRKVTGKPTPIGGSREVL